ncbi:MAG: META domain-containing protein [Chloroflexi bacterium]|nr:META domain-containing protein [Chloroflexota bacterium]
MIRKILAALLIVFALSACAGGSSNVLTGTWKLVSYGEAASLTGPIPGVDTYITFNEDGSVGGNVGCNSLGGKYQVSGDRIVFSGMFSTAMACEEPLMTQEAAVFGLLNGETTFTYEETNATLVILSADQQHAVALQK